MSLRSRFGKYWLADVVDFLRDFFRDCWILVVLLLCVCFAWDPMITTVDERIADRHKTAQEQIACHQVHGTTWTDAEGHSHCDKP